MEDFIGQENIPNSSVLIQFLEEKFKYCQNGNLAKTSIIKPLTENHCVPANINSVVLPPNSTIHQKQIWQKY